MCSRILIIKVCKAFDDQKLLFDDLENYCILNKPFCVEAASMLKKKKIDSTSVLYNFGHL